MTVPDPLGAADVARADRHRRATGREPVSTGLLADTFIELAGLLVTDFDLVDLLSVLVERCAMLLDVAETGLLLADNRHDLRVMASSSERMHVLELFEIQIEEGPCPDVYRSERPVVNAVLHDGAPWPEFSRRARAAGFVTVHAFPMRHGDRVIGVVNLFDDRRSKLGPRDVEVAQSLADIAAFVVLQWRAARDATRLADQLQGALRSRVVIEQAKGVLSESLELDMAAAFTHLRGYARRRNERIAEVARRVVDRSLAAGEVAAGA